MYSNLTHIQHFLINVKHFFENLIANSGIYSNVRWPRALKHLVISFLFKKAYKHVFNFNHRSSYCLHLDEIIKDKHVLKCLTEKGWDYSHSYGWFCVSELWVLTADTSCNALQQRLHGASCPPNNLCRASCQTRLSRDLNKTHKKLQPVSQASPKKLW